jgi:hypothetical protein
MQGCVAGSTNQRRESVKTLALAAMLAIVPAVAMAQNTPSTQGSRSGTSKADTDRGASSNAPGQRMQSKGSVTGQPGASGYAPGQQMQDRGSAKGQPGASGYAPGQKAKQP